VSAPRDPRLLVVALGGRALHGPAPRAGRGPGRRTGHEAWLRALEGSLPPVVDVAAAGFRVVLVHGGPPSVDDGRRGTSGRAAAPPLALDLRAAEVQATAGYGVQQALGNLGRTRGVDVPSAVVLTRVEVAADDAAFGRPTRAVGPPYSANAARRLGRERGWTFLGPASARRRLVPSPRPRRVLEAGVIRRLADAGVLTITAGGGGVPVIETGEGHRGVEAILEEEATAGLLATALAADRLVFLTGVDQVEVGHRTTRAIGVERLSLAEARALLKAREFPPGSIGPKIEAAVEFVEAGGREAIITSPAALRAALDGRAGTRVVR
jgi:carbamate kinase